MRIIPNFVVFEGGDGSGTTTQMGLLRRRFAETSGGGENWIGGSLRGEFVVENAPGGYFPPHFYTTFEPTDGPLGKIIRGALGGAEKSLQRETLARLFTADRQEHLFGAGGIVERCRRGELVLCDRYVPSSLVYQGIDCGEDLPRKLNEDFPHPEALLYFDLDPEIAQKRMEGREIKEIFENLDFQIQVRQRYLALLPEYAEAGVSVTIIDASKSPEEVAEEVWSALEKLPILSQ